MSVSAEEYRQKLRLTKDLEGYLNKPKRAKKALPLLIEEARRRIGIHKRKVRIFHNFQKTNLTQPVEHWFELMNFHQAIVNKYFRVIQMAKADMRLR